MRDLNYYLSLPYSLKIYLVTDDNETYYKITMPQLPGVMAFGETLKEAMFDLTGAKKIWFKKCLNDGINIPVPSDTDN